MNKEYREIANRPELYPFVRIWTPHTIRLWLADKVYMRGYIIEKFRRRVKRNQYAKVRTFQQVRFVTLTRRQLLDYVRNTKCKDYEIGTSFGWDLCSAEDARWHIKRLRDASRLD